MGDRRRELRVPGPIDYRWIDEQDDLEDVVEELLGQPRYALDTEFHRERTYYPKLALVQVAWSTDSGQELVLIDSLAVDVKAFGVVCLRISVRYSCCPTGP